MGEGKGDKKRLYMLLIADDIPLAQNDIYIYVCYQHPDTGNDLLTGYKTMQVNHPDRWIMQSQYICFSKKFF